AELGDVVCGSKSCPLFRLVMMIFVPKIFLAPADVDSCGKLGRKNSHYVPAQICWKTAFYLILLL
ncbi:hypothetical protein, partial [Pediococcus parvulus]|uniref:hypothetical protein n=1 Tax=Pediococcus parvulus TaxID=54062 RepID=UPI0021A8C5AF